MAEFEQTYNIPLRKEWRKAPRGRRAKRAISAVRSFVVKHMKSDVVLLGPNLNEKIWERGIQNPPHHVKVHVVRDKEGEVRAELVGFKFEKKVKEEKSQGLMDKVKEKAGIKDEKPKKVESEPEEKKDEVKEEKPEVKPAPKPEEKKPEVKPAPSAKPEPKPVTRPEPKPTPKPESKKE